MPNEPYVEEIMVADGDGDHPSTEEVSYETKREESHGGGTDLDSLSSSTNEIGDDDLIVTKEDGAAKWVKKTAIKAWNYISLKLGIFVGTSQEWEALTLAQKDLYRIIFKTNDNINALNAYDVPYNSTNVGNFLDRAFPNNIVIDDATSEEDFLTKLVTQLDNTLAVNDNVLGKAEYPGYNWYEYVACKVDTEATRLLAWIGYHVIVVTKIQNNVTIYDPNKITNTQTGAFKGVSASIIAGTTLDNAINTLLSNDVTLSYCTTHHFKYLVGTGTKVKIVFDDMESRLAFITLKHSGGSNLLSAVFIYGDTVKLAESGSVFTISFNSSTSTLSISSSTTYWVFGCFTSRKNAVTYL